MVFAASLSTRTLSYFVLASVCVFLLFSKDCIEQSFPVSPSIQTIHTVAADAQSIQNSTLGVRILFLKVNTLRLTSHESVPAYFRHSSPRPA